ncbi:MAG: hypothetical protein LLG45_12760 [Actinomycetia bacterium]|nr:hypothetical protein [Actinomycetes bacterium]
MGLMDKVTAGVERFAEEADKAIDKGKAKVGELQIELQMDGLAKKLGYLVFDFYRGRQVDQAQRQQLLDELSRLEDKLFQAKAEAAAKAQATATAEARAASATEPPTAGSPTAGSPTAGSPAAGSPAADTPPATEAGASGDSSPGPASS